MAKDAAGAGKAEAVSDLGALLAGMSPEQIGGKYFIACVEEGQLMAVANYLDYVVAVFREGEGLTIVFTDDIHAEMSELTDKEIAGPFALITLSVHSDLMAVGFLAEITRALAKEGISVNAFSAYYHDHLLVPYARKDDALKVLVNLSGKKR